MLSSETSCGWQWGYTPSSVSARIWMFYQMAWRTLLADIGDIGVFLSFFLVLFVNDANSTVKKMHGLSMQCKARILDVATLSRGNALWFWRNFHSFWTRVDCGFVGSKFREIILKEQDTFAELFDNGDQAISFAYYHFICFLSAVCLPLFAMSSALDAGIGDAAYWLTDVVAGLIVVL